jgi:hypothetical protein
MAVKRIPMRVGDSGARGESAPPGPDHSASGQDHAGCPPPQVPLARPPTPRARAVKQWPGSYGWPAALEAELGLRSAAQGTWPQYLPADDDDLRAARRHLLGPACADQAAALNGARSFGQHRYHDGRPPPSRPEGPGHGSSAGNGSRSAAAGHQAASRHRRRYGARTRPGSERALRAGRWHWWLLAVAVVLAAFSAVAPGLGHQRAGRRGGGSSTAVPAPAVSAAAIRGLAGRWIAKQVSPGAIVACDPAMCATLQANGLPLGDTLVLGSGASDPLGSDVVVATTAIRDQFGSRLSEVYAPDVIARFGSGNARIEIRAVAPDGAAAYRAALSADLLARKAAGAQLLLNSRIEVSAMARGQLAAGEPDSRLLITLAALAPLHALYIAAFGDAGQGASPSMPLRSVSLALSRPVASATGGTSGPAPSGLATSAAGGAGAAGTAGYLSRMLTFLRAQRPPFVPSSVQIARSAGEQPILRIEFAAPSPLGLLGGSDYAIELTRPHKTS